MVKKRWLNDVVFPVVPIPLLTSYKISSMSHGCDYIGQSVVDQLNFKRPCDCFLMCNFKYNNESNKKCEKRVFVMRQRIEQCNKEKKKKKKNPPSSWYPSEDIFYEAVEKTSISYAANIFDFLVKRESGCLQAFSRPVRPAFF